MIEIDPSSGPTYILPEEIGVAVVAHFAHQILDNRPLPDADRPEDVLDVAQTIMNHTGVESEELAHMIPAVRVLMGLYNESLKSSE